MTDFSKIPFHPNIARAIAEMGYTAMTPIQAQAIPVVLAGRDVMGAAQTGTGKTAAFSLPLLQRLMAHENASASPARHPVRALVLLPTRELADQVAGQIAQYARHTKLRSAVVFGGMDMKPQAAQLKSGVEVLVATPGRLLDHIEARNVVLNQVEYVVLDEADRMLDIGFLPDLQRILSHLPRERTTLLFSATFSNEIKRLAASYLREPTTIEVAPPNQTAATVEQRFYAAANDDKRRAIGSVIVERGITQAFIFSNSKLGCARLARALERDGFRTAALHGDKSQDERLKALEAFKSGEVQLLVCTDVAARGLDIKDVPAVFNHDVPFNAEDYVHRIGRTGRAGATGLAVTLVAPNDAKLVAEIEKLTAQKITVEPAPMLSWRERSRAVRGDAADWGADSDENYENGSKPRVPHSAKNGQVGDDRPRRRFTSERAADPFFDRPYEPQVSDTPPSWERAAPTAATTRAGGARISANIRPARRVAALFKPHQL